MRKYAHTRTLYGILPSCAYVCKMSSVKNSCYMLVLVRAFIIPLYIVERYLFYELFFYLFMFTMMTKAGPMLRKPRDTYISRYTYLETFLRLCSGNLEFSNLEIGKLEISGGNLTRHF